MVQGVGSVALTDPNQVGAYTRLERTLRRTLCHTD